MTDNRIWLPPEKPKPGIVELEDTLKGPGALFCVSLSPYVCVSLKPREESICVLPPRSLRPDEVRFFNAHVRGQSQDFILAKDRESLTWSGSLMRNARQYWAAAWLLT
jgi:hypothetical protein